MPPQHFAELSFCPFQPLFPTNIGLICMLTAFRMKYDFDLSQTFF